MGYLQTDDSATSPRSLKQRFRSGGCFSCCFRVPSDSLEPYSPSSNGGSQAPTSLIHHPSTWLRSKAQELPEELRERYRGIVTRLGRHRRHAGDFGYDALSYALNFDDGLDREEEGQISPGGFRYRSFSSRLPPTPPHPTAPAKEISCS